MSPFVLTLALLFVAPAPAPSDPSTAWSVVEIGVGGVPQRVRAAPLDGDALPDLVLVLGPMEPLAAVDLVVLRNVGNGRFEPHWDIGLNSRSATNGVPFALGDLDDDGDIDLVYTNASGGPWFLTRLGDDTGSFPEVLTTTPGKASGIEFYDIQLVDYDADGRLDITLADEEFGVEGFLDRWRGVGDGSFTDYAFGDFGLSDVPLEMGVATTALDDKPHDVVAGPSGVVAIRSNFTHVDLLDTPASHAIGADLDGDGVDEIVVSVPHEHELQLLFGVGTSTPQAPVSVPVGRRPTALLAVDFDDDGDLDLAVCNSASQSVSLLFNRGDGALRVAPPIRVGREPSDLAAADLDLDGDLDLLVANRGSDSVSVLLNPGR